MVKNATTRRHLAIVPNVTVDNPLVAQYLAYCEANLRRSGCTIHQKRMALRQLCRFLAELLGGDERDPDVLLVADLPELLAWQQWVKQRVAVNTSAYYTSAVRGLYAWLASRASGRLLPEDPAAELPVPSYSKGLPRPLDTEDLYLALDAAHASDQRMYAWLMLMAGCGLRCCEVAQIDKSRVSWDEPDRVVRIQVVRKGSKASALLGGPGVYSALLPWRGVSGPWFTSRSKWADRDVRITARLVSDYVKRYLRGLGIKGATAHQLRHWAGTTAYRARKDLMATKEYMGHESIATTVGYVQVVEGAGNGISRDVDEVLVTRGGRHIRAVS